MKFRSRLLLLYVWFILSNLAGRELFGNSNYNLKYYYLFFLLFIIIVNIKFLFHKIYNIKLIYLFFILSFIASVKGYNEGNRGVFFNNIISFGLFFYILGYIYINTEEKLNQFIKLNIICFIFALLIKEVLFIQSGTSLFFTFSDLRDYSMIRKSSDTVNSLGLIALIYTAVSKNKFKIIAITFIMYVIYRYGVRSSFFAIFAVFTYHMIKYLPKFMKEKIKKLIPVIIISVLILLLVNWSEIKYIIVDTINELSYEGIDQYGTFIWRLSELYDSFNTIFNDSSYLIGTSGKEVKFILTAHGYVNPHNSYVYVLVNYGVINLFLIVIIPLRTLYYKGDLTKQNKLFEITAGIVVMYLVLSLGTPIFELSYQGCTFWFFLGAYQKLKERVPTGENML